MTPIIWVAAGGALGATARHVMNHGLERLLGTGFPWGILVVNILGCFAMGLLTAGLWGKAPANETARLFLATGFLGGFTTFSAFALDTMKLMQSGQNLSALAYVLASVAVSIIAVFAGFMLMRGIA